MRRILVTGCAGFIGSHVTEALLQQGKEVIGIDNFCDFYNPVVKRANIAKAVTHKNFHLYEVNICHKADLQQVFATYKPNCVVHLAAMAGVRSSIEQPDLYNEVNITGTLNVLEAMKNNGVQKFVFGSSSSVYGDSEQVPFVEIVNVDKTISPYAATKKAGELLAHTYYHLYGIDMALLRFFTVYGERQRPDLAIHKFTRLISEGQPIPFYGNGETCRDYTYIGDIVNGVLAAIKFVETHHNVYEIFNLGESRTISLKKMVETLENALGKRAIIDWQPMQQGDVKQTFADISKAKKLLGYNPKMDFEEGIKRFVKWYQENKTKLD